MKYAICNETFEGWDHARVCGRAAELGYTGLELAPFTLAPRITDVSATRRAALRRHAERAGVAILGLHWLLAKTEGFHVTTADAAVRRATGDYLADLARACADLGGTILVLGSPPFPFPKEGAGAAAFGEAFREWLGKLADSPAGTALYPFRLLGAPAGILYRRRDFLEGGGRFFDRRGLLLGALG